MTPRRARIREPSTAGSIPSTVRVPLVTGETQPIIRIVLVLPAPFGPRKPNDSPRATSKSMPSTAVKSPKRLVSPRAWMSDVDRSVDAAPGLGAATATGGSDMDGHGTPSRRPLVLLEN